MIEKAPTAIRNTIYVSIIACSLVLMFLFWARGMHFFLVPSSSMEPTLFPGDHIMTMREDTYQRGDVVVLDDPEEEGSFVVKRIVAVENDSVSAFDGALFINGRYVSEPYTKDDIIKYSMEGLTVPENAVFVLGDNRNNSNDSHIWAGNDGNGTGRELHVSIDRIIGKVHHIYLPLNRAGKIRSFPIGYNIVKNKPEN